MMKIYRILGKRGRITIPLEIRKELNFTSNDILSFTSQGNQVVITKEKICDNCVRNFCVQDILESLSAKEKHELLNCLMKEYRSTKLKG